MPDACTNATAPGAPLPGAPVASSPRGVLQLPGGVSHGRLPACAELAPLVEHYWWVRWDLALPSASEVLSYPSVHLVFEGQDACIVGVVREKFVRRLEGKGEVFGIKFRPGMFHPVWARPVCQLTDRTLPLTSELGVGVPGLIGQVLAAPSAPLRAELARRWLCELSLRPSPRALLARDLVEQIRADSALSSVRDLARSSGLSERALQRLFRDFVGVGPKWILRRFRLQEAAALLASTRKSVASVAASAGYFDQAHFAHEFRAVVGEAPLDFARRARQPRGPTTTVR